MTSGGNIHIQQLGELRVTRADGSVVDNYDWRTGPTRNLLTLIALENGQPVRIDVLLAKLWPHARPDRARASLRTAVSQVRRVMGTDCILRRPDHLVLVGSRVDTEEFLRARAEMRRARAARDPGAGLEAAIRAERLYAGDFHAYQDDSDWVVVERDHLRAARHEVLSYAAECALELRRVRDAIDFACEAIEVDPVAESPHRSLMQAYAEVGEVAGALRVFESYRTRIADELGVDPSPGARALHLQLLRGRVS